MKRFSMILPPFAPDYSGVASALFDLNGLIVIHDASGCTGNYTGFDEPRWYGSRKPLYCSGLRKMDAVFGNEEALIEKILRAERELPTDFIALVGSPVPMVIGTDFEGLARELECRSGVPAFGFASNGTQFYGTGVVMAARAVLDRFGGEAMPREARTVNLLGATPLDFSGENLDALRALLAENGWRVRVCCATGWKLDDLRHIGAASVNLAVSQAGRVIAADLARRYGTPWIEGLPVGRRGAAALFDDLQAAAGGHAPPRASLPERADALVMGDLVCAGSVCRALKLDFGIDAMPMGLFGRTGALPQEVVLEDESEIEGAVQGASLLVADPLICELAPASARRIRLPQYAVSSRLHAGRLFIGQYFNKMAANAVEER